MTIKNTFLSIIGLIFAALFLAVPVIYTQALTLTDIEIETPANKLTYIVGETLDITDLVVFGFSDGMPLGPLPVTTDNITGFDSSIPVAGQELTITVDGVSTSYTIDIVEAPDTTPPAVLSITTKDTDNDGAVDTATIVFDEDILDSSFVASDFTIGGAPADMLDIGSSADDDTISVIVSAGVSGTEGKDVTYTPGSVTDIAGNSLAGITTLDIEEIDSAGPVPVSATIVDSTTIEVVFSEDIHGSSDNPADFAVDGNTTDSTSESDGVVTLTLGTAVSAGDTPSVTVYGDGEPYTGLKDLEGNWSPQEYTLTPVNEIPAPAPVPPTLTDIEIDTPASKLTYTVGEELDITGLEVFGYSDAMPLGPLPVTTDNISGFDSSIPAVDQELTITVNGISTTYTVTIEAVPLGSIEIETPADKLTYIVGDTLDITGLVVFGSNSVDMPLGPLPITTDNISGFDSSEPVEGQIITITIGELSTTYTVDVVSAPAPASTGGGGGFVLTTSLSPASPYDINKDGGVDLIDLINLIISMINFVDTGTIDNTAGDINIDSAVDIFDFNLWINNWQA